MKKIVAIVLLLNVFLSFSQEKNLEETWVIGIGGNAFLMHGDLTSLNPKSNGVNLGYYVYLQKMLSPTFGFELKGQVLKMKGASQEFSDSYPVLYAETEDPNNLYFKGSTFGGEFNIVLNLNNSFNNPYAKENHKLNLNAYAGFGYHTYDSKLYRLDDDALLLDYGTVIERQGYAKSIYYTAGLGLRYKLSKRLDVELRQTINFNNEDNLDATISQKQNFESFLTTNLGFVIKLQSYSQENVIWKTKNNAKDKEVDDIKEKLAIEEVLKDSDGDGVIDKFDQDPNTPKGALVYGNGKAIDTDKDGVIDFYDKCPLLPGTKEDGCPLIKDSDGDNVPDNKDLCPDEKGDMYNQGCPVIETIIEKVSTRIINLAKNIFFDYGKHSLRESSKKELDKIAVIMLENPDLKFEIGGHTDRGGTKEYNLILSQKRADEVMKYLVSRGVPQENLKAVGYGFSKPKYNNFSSEEKRLNRRVEIVLEKEKAPTKINEPKETLYMVKDGDTLFLISQKFNVSIEDIKKWNNLNDDLILKGQSLIIIKNDE